MAPSLRRADGPDTVLESFRLPFVAGMAAIGNPLTETQADRLFEFVSLLQRWNVTHNLTAVSTAEGLVQTHLTDSLLALPFVRERWAGLAENRRQAILDVGSGAGVPAIPWALACDDLTLHLVEKVGKKVAFLRHSAARLGLTNRLTMLQKDVRDLRTPPSYAMITSRAFAALPRFLLLTQHLSAPGTRWMYMAGHLETVQGIDLDKSMYTHPTSMPTLQMQVSLEHIDVLSDPSGARRHLIWLKRQT